MIVISIPSSNQDLPLQLSMNIVTYRPRSSTFAYPLKSNQPPGNAIQTNKQTGKQLVDRICPMIVCQLHAVYTLHVHANNVHSHQLYALRVSAKYKKSAM